MSEAELRAMVRDVLREALAGRKANGVAAAAASEPVRIASDADLAAFVQRIVKLLDDPKTGQAIRAGRHRFALAGTPAPLPASVVARPGGAAIVLEGTVTESKINKCAGAGMIVLAPGAVVTPLARDRARALGLKLERKR